MQAGHDNGCIQGAKDRGEQNADVRGKAPVHSLGDGVANGPANGSHQRVGDDDRGHQRAERHHDHAYNLGRDLGEELLKPHQHKSRQQRRDDLALVADHLNLGEPEVPHGNFRHGRARYREAVEKLAGHQRKSKNDAQNLRGSHLLGHRPADAHRQHVEHRLADEPQEVVDTHPKRRDIRDGHHAALKVEGTRRIKEVDLANDVAETQDKTAGNQRGDKRGEDLAQDAHGALQRILVATRRLFRSLLGNALDPGNACEIVVELGNVVADDDLELPRLRKRPLDACDLLDLIHLRPCGVNQHKSHPSHAVRHGRDVLLASHQRQQRLSILHVLAHTVVLPLFSRSVILFE